MCYRVLLALAATVLTLFASASADAANQYRRWLAPKNFTCTSGAQVQVGIDNQDVEFANLPADAQFTINYIVNGATTTDGPFTVEQTSGTHAYGAFAQVFPSYPAHFVFRLDTLINGSVVYTSAIDINCTGDAAGAATITNVDIGLSPVPYRRWSLPKNYTCTSLGGGLVQIAIDNQNVEFNALPPDAQFTINYIVNGVTTTDGPFTVEQTSGIRPYGAFAQNLAGYPAHFVFRLDTLIGGVVVYRSSLDISCSGDATGPAVRINEAGPFAPVGVANPIPTLSGWMLLALAMMMVVLGAARARR